MHTHTTSMAPTVAGPNIKLYVVAALTATLAAAVVVTVVFVVLSPARVSFTVARAGISRQSSKDDDVVEVELVLTLAANNTSRRAAVRYESLFVDVSNSTGPQKANIWIAAEVTTPMPLMQPRASAVAVGAKVPLVPGPVTAAFTGNWTSDSFSVTVTAAARFVVGAARTRLYDIKVSCGPVSFFAVDGAAEQSGGAPSRLPVACV
ncbi:hypothetical protein ACP70R_041962 [Stipagrostis hirtigluma subsp. patula]